MSNCTATTPRRLDRDERRAIVEKHMGYAEFLADRKASRSPNMRDDLLSAAYQGLIGAAESFEPDRGYAFSTHAKRRIWGAMIDYQRSVSPQGYKRGDIERPAIFSLSISVDTEFDHDGRGMLVADRLENGEEPAGNAIEFHDMLKAIGAGLKPKARIVFLAYFRDGLKMKEAAKLAGLSESRASQLISQSIREIRERIEADHKDRLGMSHYTKGNNSCLATVRSRIARKPVASKS